MMEEILAGVTLILLFLAMFYFYLWKRRQNFESPVSEEEQVPHVEAVVRNSATRRMRRRPAAACTSAAPTVVEEDVARSDEDAPVADYYVAKASTKKEKKRQERDAQRQAEEAARESRQTKRDQYEEMRRRKDEEREAQERLMVATARARTFEEEMGGARELDEWSGGARELDKWRDKFSVDAEGSAETEAQNESQYMLCEFMEYIKKNKCIPLEDLAAEFKIRTKDCINRIATLDDMGRLSGVMDGRGKYIYISSEEMKAVADYIKRQGRVSVSHLASNSNQFIDLEPKPLLVTELSGSDGIIVA
eukprot:TRINITY_DN8093_c0_g1_i2.p1 TRINITY_DN8093_c0_g1~~TRINITY_DN8093_c0_g1_i2.p1  ORF type:complete len:306 (-),score=72.21 TRINITY_DN8093_c0_g1_i2:57-974(-)